MRPTEWKRIAAVAAVTTIGLLVAVGCGGDDGGDSGGDTVSADDYVSSVCTAIGDMAGVLQDSQSELQQALTSDPEEGKDLLVGFLSEAAETVGSAQDDLEAAGTPDVDDGEEIAEAIPAAFGDLETAISDAAADAENISTDSPTEFAEQAQAVGETVQEAGEQISASLDELGTSQELEEAAADSEACQNIGSA